MKLYDQKETAKKLRIILPVIVAALAVILFIRWRHIPGAELLGYMRAEEVAAVTVKKTHADGNGDTALGEGVLNAEELERFYDLLEASTYQKIHSQYHRLTSRTLYELEFSYSDERISKTMEIQGDLLRYSYWWSLPEEDYIAYGFDKNWKGRYKIISSELEAFLAKLLPEEYEGK